MPSLFDNSSVICIGATMTSKSVAAEKEGHFACDMVL